MEDSSQCKFYLGGLDPSTTEETLNSYFSQFGTITDCIVMREPSTKSSRRYGFVTFSSNEESEACFNGGPHTVDGVEIDVQKAMPKGGKGKAEAGKKIFVGGLNPETTDEGLKQYFDQFGEVVDCIVMKHKDTSKSRCFGFVTYSSTDMVDTVQQNRPHSIDGSKVETKRATTREDSSRGGGDSGKSVKKIFVGGFKIKLEDSDLQSYFSNYGTVTFCKQILEKGTGKKLGFGFVEFDDYDPVDKIIIQGQHEINGVRVDIRKALGKDEMQGGGGRGGFGGKRGAAGGGWGGNQGGYGGNYNNGYGGGWGGSQGGFGSGNWDQSQQGYGGGSWGGQGAAAGGGWSDPSGGWGAGAAGGGYMAEGGWGGGYGAAGGMGGGGGAMRNSMGGRGNRSTPYSGGRGGGRGRGGAGGAGGRW